MKRIYLSSVLVILFLVSPQIISAQLPGLTGGNLNESMIQPREDYVQVTGTADKEVIPDVFTLRIVINENDNKGKVSIEKQEKSMIDILKSLGIDTEKNLKVENINSNINKKNKTRTIKVYQLKLNDSDILASVYQEMETINISNITLVEVTHSKIKEFEKELKIEAIKKAQETASAYAVALNQSIGRAIYILDNYYGGGFNPRPYMLMKSAAVANEDMSMSDQQSIEFKSIKVGASVTVKFVLK